jgi:hypothetical protein
MSAAQTTAAAASAADRAWFATHPWRSYRVRRAILGELPSVTIANVAIAWIAVKRLGPDGRLRGGFTVTGKPGCDLTDAPEDVGRTSFHLSLERPGEVVSRALLEERAVGEGVAMKARDYTPASDTVSTLPCSLCALDRRVWVICELLKKILTPQASDGAVK